VLAMLIWILDIRELRDALQSADYRFVALASVSVPVWIALKALKWHLLLRSFWSDGSFSLALKSFLCGFSFGVLTPGKVGEFSRVFFLPYHDKSRGVSLVIIDRYCDLVALLFLSVFGVTHFTGFAYGSLVLFAGVGAGILFFLSRFLLEQLPSWSSFATLNNLLDRLRKNPRIKATVFLKVLLLSLCCFLVSVATSFSLLLAFHELRLLDALAVFPLTLLTNVLPITIGNLGIREGATIYLLGPFGVEKEAAFHVSLMLFVLHSVIPAAIGSIIQLLTQSRPNKKISKLN